MAKKKKEEDVDEIDEGKTFKIVDGDMSDGHHTFDELYEHRIMLFINLIVFGGFPSQYKKEHFKGWDAVYLELPTGQISYHLPIKYRYLYEKECKDITNSADCFDGHTSNDVLFRMERASFYGTDNQ